MHGSKPSCSIVHVLRSSARKCLAIKWMTQATQGKRLDLQALQMNRSPEYCWRIILIIWWNAPSLPRVNTSLPESVATNVRMLYLIKHLSVHDLRYGIYDSRGFNVQDGFGVRHSDTGSRFQRNQRNRGRRSQDLSKQD